MGNESRLERRENSRKDRRSGNDPLTGLYNRQHIVDQLEKDCRRARRYGTPLACLMLDIDGFKELNNKHGHIEGDNILRQVASAISKSLREIDVAARYGSDEFCILAPETGLDGALLLAERLRSAIAAMEVVAGRHSLTVTASVGVFSPATMNQVRPTTLIEYAEAALRKAKLTGNQVCAYSVPSVTVA
jgi:diguanylate cyclase (GGDEF)-like protein